LFDRVGLEDQISFGRKSNLQLVDRSGLQVNENRPVILLSSSSYTPDEDFMELVEALDVCDKDSKCPQIQVIVTGKGPLKDYFAQIFK